MSRSVAASLQIDAHFNPLVEDIDPQLAADVRAWREARRVLDSHKVALSVGKKADNTERDLRAKVAAHFPGPDSITLDGEIITYEPGTRGGGDPDFETAWGALYTKLGTVEGGDVWRGIMADLLAAHKTAPTITHRLTAVPAAVPVPAAPESRARAAR